MKRYATQRNFSLPLLDPMFWQYMVTAVLQSPKRAPATLICPKFQGSVRFFKLTFPTIDIIRLYHRFLADGRQQGEAPQESIVWEMEQERTIGLRRICGGLSAPLRKVSQ